MIIMALTCYDSHIVTIHITHSDHDHDSLMIMIPRTIT